MSDRIVMADDIVGLAEVCEIIEFSDGYVSLMLKDPDSGFPEPIKVVKLGRLWDAKEVRMWKAKWDQRVPGRPGPKPKPQQDKPAGPSAEDRRALMDKLLGKDS